MVAQDLLTWPQHLCLDGELAKAGPKRLRYCVLHVARRIARSGRRSFLRLDTTWPWVKPLARACERLRALGLPPHLSAPNSVPLYGHSRGLPHRASK